MKRKEIIIISNAINKFKDIRSVKFAYGLARNRKLINDEIKVMQESLEKLPEKFTDENKKFEEKKTKLYEKHCIKDASEKPLLEGNAYRFEKDNIEIVNQGVKKIEKEHEELSKEIEKMNKKNDELLEEDCDIKFYKIKIDNVPEGISLTDIDPIMDLIVD